MSRREWAGLALVLMLAGGLRLGWPDLTEFKRDEAALYALALDVAEFKAFPLRGIGSSVGVPNTPISVYVFALPLFVWKSPLAATLWVGALNTAAVGLAYAFARRYWGARAALAAGLLFAAAPWAVIYARKIWAQNLLPPFVMGYVFTAALTFVEGRRGWLLGHLLLLAVLAQLHYAGLLAVPVTVLLIGLYRRRVDRRALWAGALAAAFTAAPFAWYLVTQLSRGAWALGGLGGRPLTVSADSVALAALVALGADIHSLAGPQAFRAYLATLPDFTVVGWLGGGLIAAGAGLAVWRFRRDRFALAAQAGVLVVGWLIWPSLAFLAHVTPVYPHYFIALFPAPYLLAGIAVDAWLKRFPHGLAHWAGGLAPVAVAGAQVWAFAALLSFLATQATPGAFGVPLGRLLAVAEQTAGAADVVVVSAGADPALDEVPAVFEALLRTQPPRFVDGRTTAVWPAGEAVVVVWPAEAGGALTATARYQSWTGGQWAATVPLRTGEGAVRIARVTGAVALAPPRPRPASALLANGAEVLGSGGDARVWELWWRAPDGAAEVTAFAHLLDAAGNRTAQVDAPTYPARGWRGGDWVVSVFALDGAGSAVRAGFYESATLAPVEVLDAAGNPAGPWLEFELP